MLSKHLRSAATLMILAMMTIAGLPIIVCVSEAHGAAIEFKHVYADHHDRSQAHRTLFGSSDNALDSGCSDFRLDRGVLLKQSRVKRSPAVMGTGTDAPGFAAFASSPLPLSYVLASKVTSRAVCPIVRSSLSDLSTIVLLI
jgi:hypothetical protein